MRNRKIDPDIASAYVRIFGDLAGKTVLQDLVERFHVLSSTHKAGDPYTTAFQEGQRSVVTHILALMNSDIVMQARDAVERTNK